MQDDNNSVSFDFFKKVRTFVKSVLALVLLAIILLIIFLWQASPVDFYGVKKIRINSGDSVSTLASNLKEEGLIRSEKMFKLFVKIFGDDKKILPGEYTFTKSEPVFAIVLDILNIKNRTNVYRLTIPEGFSNYQISRGIKLLDSEFNADDFVAKSKDLEGYLFPDTYLFERGTSADEIIRKMNENFDAKTRILLASDLKGKTKKEIIIMASIIEKESNEAQEQKMISGILWKRMKEGIPLQVDAPFQYLLGKASNELTYEDLKNNSPFNLYKNKGLTPTPIGNPGLTAIYAAINPESSKYYFYLHGDDGQIHYSKTFAEHKQNKLMYIK